MTIPTLQRVQDVRTGDRVLMMTRPASVADRDYSISIEGVFVVVLESTKLQGCSDWRLIVGHHGSAVSIDMAGESFIVVYRS